MESLYMMISVPSAEYEKLIWLEENFVQPEDKASNLTQKDMNSIFQTSGSEKSMFSRSLSNDSVNTKTTTENKRRSHSAVHMSTYNKNTPMENRLENCLKELKIPNAVWVLGRAGKYYQVSFCTPAGEQCEHIIQLLNENKIGIELNSTVSILPCSLYYEGKEHISTSNKASSNILTPQTCVHGMKELTYWEQFVNSVRARLMVAQVVAGVKSNALFTFDFLVLLIIASVTAAVGLVENSLVILVASMLISPLMGPVMASTFGYVTNDWKLQKIGVLNELLGLLLGVFIGFLYGLIIGYLRWESPDFTWPTPEMLTRGNLRSLWVGALIALLSGAAVAIAVLGNYSGSLTGVAISASLMPPAVNAGLLWALAVIVIWFGDSNPQNLSGFTSGDPVTELLILGALSLALTFINILCIFVMGILVLKIKEVSPRGSKDYSRLLWKETIQIARDYKKNLSQSAERLDQGPISNPLSDIFSQTQYKMGLNEYTWTAYGGIHELHRPNVDDLAIASYQYSLHPPNVAFPGLGRGAGRASPSHHLSRLWGVTGLNSPISSAAYMTVNDHDTLSPPLPCPATQSCSRRFTVTPTDANILL